MTAAFNPLQPIGQGIVPQPVTHSTLVDYMAGPVYRELLTYFHAYPPRSLMTPESRCVLFALVRMMQPQSVAEVGTLFAGTAELMARALWENGAGEIHTTDPYGAERCPGIIATWPTELQRHARYYPLNSMDFFQEMSRQRLTLDLALIDGNHDYEFALFDLQMAARLLRPGGVIVMDNAEQTGPFEASRAFVEHHPAWRELGDAIGRHDSDSPFVATRASLPGTTFIVLQAPPGVSIGVGPHSWQIPLAAPFIGGLSIEMPTPSPGGTLHYRAFARGFADNNRWIREVQTIGAIRIEAGSTGAVVHRFPAALAFDPPPPCHLPAYVGELELSWRADDGAAPLTLASVPVPVES